MQKLVLLMAFVFAAVICIPAAGRAETSVKAINSWNGGLQAYQKGDYSEAAKLFNDAIARGLDEFRLDQARQKKAAITAFDEANAAVEKQRYDDALPLFIKALQVPGPMIGNTVTPNYTPAKFIHRYYRSFNPRQVESCISLGRCYVMMAAQTGNDAQYSEGLEILETVWTRDQGKTAPRRTFEKILQDGFISLLDKKDYFADDNLTVRNTQYDNLSSSMFQHFFFGEEVRGDDLEGTLAKIDNAKVLFYYASVMLKSGKSSEAKKIYEHIVMKHKGTDYERKATSVIAQLAKTGGPER